MTWNACRCPIIQAGRAADPLVWDSYLDPDVALDAYALLRAALVGDNEAAEFLIDHASLTALALRLARFGAMTLVECVGHDQAAALLSDSTSRVLAESGEVTE